jgi:hypothetical protein
MYAVALKDDWGSWLKVKFVSCDQPSAVGIGGVLRGESFFGKYAAATKLA